MRKDCSQDSCYRHRQQEWFKPILHVTHEIVVHEYFGECGNYQARYHESETGQKHVAKGKMTSPQAADECPNERRIFAASPELWSFLEGQHHTGKGLIEFFWPYHSGAGSGIAQVILITVDSLNNEKVIEVPKDNKRQPEVAQLIRFAFETLACEPILARCLQNVTCFDTIARHSACEPKLFESNDASVIAQNDFQRCRPAFHCLHLDHRRGSDTPSLECECGLEGTHQTLEFLYEW